MYLDIEMHHVVFVHVFESFAHLADVPDHFSLSHLVVFRCYTVKQLTTRQTENIESRLYSYLARFIFIYIRNIILKKTESEIRRIVNSDNPNIEKIMEKNSTKHKI